jgi:hypothetical protein
MKTDMHRSALELAKRAKVDVLRNRVDAPLECHVDGKNDVVSRHNRTGETRKCLTESRGIDESRVSHMLLISSASELLGL